MSVPTYLPNTNILVKFGRDPIIRSKLQNAGQGGFKFVIAPVALTEIAVGVVEGGAAHFDQNRQVFEWLHAQAYSILDLPRLFMGKVLGVPSQRSNVETHHQIQRIVMVAESKTFDDFLQRTDEPDSAWTGTDKSPELHDSRIDFEFDALEKLAKSKPFDRAMRFSETFGEKGSHPDPTVFRQHFSAALEYGEASLAKIIRNRAKPRKNDRGLYCDFNLLFYLADLNITFLTEDRRMLADIKLSPQRTRIVGLDSLS